MEGEREEREKVRVKKRWEKVKKKWREKVRKVVDKKSNGSWEKKIEEVERSGERSGKKKLRVIKWENGEENRVTKEW